MCVGVAVNQLILSASISALVIFFIGVSEHVYPRMQTVGKIVQWPRCEEMEGNLTNSLMGIVNGEFQRKVLKGAPSRLLPLLQVLLSTFPVGCIS